MAQADQHKDMRTPVASEAEVEYKFTVPRTALLPHLSGLLMAMDAEVAPSVRRHVRDVFLDTPDWWFYRAGMVCRLRCEDDKTSIEFKTLAPIREGVAVRKEFREPLPVTPEDRTLVELPGEKLRAWVAPLMFDPRLEVKGILNQFRAIYQVEASGGLLMEVSGDLVQTKNDEFGQIEMELLEGERETLTAFAEDFRERYGLLSETRSKFQQAVASFGNPPPSPPRDEDMLILPGDRVVDAAYKILSRELAHLLWNEPGTRLGMDAECLHDMRVATRRMRAALQVFRDVLPPRRCEWMKRTLQWLGKALGRVRDLDVSLLRYSEMLARIPEKYRPALERYHSELYRRREKAREAMIRTLNTKRFRNFGTRCQAILQDGPPKKPRPSYAAHPIAVVAPDLIDRLLKRVRKDGRALSGKSEDAAFHALRIRCKRLRYACEFFTDLYGKPAATFARRVKKMQTLLGEHQDAIVAQAMLDEFAHTVRAPRAEACSLTLAFGQLIAHEIRRAQRTRRQSLAEWKKFDRKKIRRPLKNAMDRIASKVQHRAKGESTRS